MNTSRGKRFRLAAALLSLSLLGTWAGLHLAKYEPFVSSPKTSHISQIINESPSLGPTLSSEDETVQEVSDAELDQWLREAGADAPGTLARALKVVSPRHRKELLEWILAAWATEGIERVRDWLVLTLPGLSQEQAIELLHAAEQERIVEEPEKVMAWVKGSFSGGTLNIASRWAAETWAHQDHESFDTWLSNPANQESAYIEELVFVLTERDPEAAIKWINTLKDPSLVKELQESVVQSLAFTNPERAASMAAELGLPEPEKLEVPVLAPEIAR